jgi:hypothetical protein
MKVERVEKILKDSGVTREEFAVLLGVKPSTMRVTWSNGRFSKKALTMLEDWEADLPSKEAQDVKEGMIKQSNDERQGKVYLVPKNPYIRMVEFADGSHGRFKAQPGRFLLGSIVLLKREDGDMWRLVGRYDRKDRLL